MILFREDGDDEDLWSSADVAVPAQQPVAVYVNADGEIVVRQRCDQEDVAVLVTRENALALAQAIVSAAGHAVDAIPARPRSDATAAERQRRYRERKRNGRDARDGVTRRDGNSVHMIAAE